MIEGLCAYGERTVGLGLTGGPGTLLEVVLLSRGERVFRVLGIAINRTREAYVGASARAIPATLGYHRRPAALRVALPEIRFVLQTSASPSCP